jgi:cytochrome b subunit of formate dehydrogenase
MPDLPIAVPHWYISLTGLIWGLVGLVLCYGLFRTYAWALRMLCLGSLIYVGWYWIDRLLFTYSEYSRVSLPASVTLTIITLGALYWIQRNPDVRAAFQGNKENKQ